jgi:predicted HAD superfamily Cof-like phosphohydrolase
MSKDWSQDMYEMHHKYGVHEWVKNNPEKLKEFLEFRIKFLQEELDETRTAFANQDPEEIVDGLIDLCVIAIGTLDAFGVDAHTAWNEVWRANMAKEVGVKKERPNPLGLPDLVKPEGWTNPSHEGNHGSLVNAV